MPVLGRARRMAGSQARVTSPAEPVQRAADRLLVVVHDGIPVRALVAGEPEGVEAERVGVGRGALLLDQAAEDAHLHGIQVHANVSSPKANDARRNYRICTPEMARAMTSRWISEVPSKIV